jgi:dTDP-4-dehydrorhamnose 3,5-epimerase
MVKLVLHDARESSPSYGRIDQFCLGDYNPAVVLVPAGVQQAWRSLGVQQATLLICTGDIGEPERAGLGAVAYDWEPKFH